jgi:hypothetical protein
VLKAILAFTSSITLALGITLVTALPGHAGDEREVWWTTTQCPPGVQAPCLDPTVSVHDLPEWALR